MIQGFPKDPSAYPGQTIILFVSTDAPKFRIDFYRQGSIIPRESFLSTCDDFRLHRSLYRGVNSMTFQDCLQV